MKVAIREFLQALYPEAISFIVVQKHMREVRALDNEKTYTVAMTELKQDPFHAIGYCPELKRVFYSLAKE